MQYAQRLDEMERRFEALTVQMADPAVINDSQQYRKVGKYRQWKAASGNLAEARSMINESDPELRTMAQEEIAKLEPLLVKYEEELKIFLLPKDPNDDKNIVLEIRAGTGGDEATLFAAEVFRMYSRFAEA